jgi:hypothetical protein
MHRAATWPVVIAACFVAGACSGPGEPPVYALQASGGPYDDGSGRLGLAVVATVRDARGNGPEGWDAVLLDGGAPAAHARWSGSWGALVFPAAFPDANRYALELRGDGVAPSTAIAGPASAPLALPAPALSAEGDRLTWAALAGAGSYACRVEGETGLARETLGTEPSCSLAGLPAGPWAISVLAYGADLQAIAASTAQAPVLPESFPVTEARVGVGVGSTGEPVVLRAAGGRIDFGLGSPGLAVWLSITSPDGGPTGDTWDLTITGPGLPASLPLETSYPGALPRVMQWAYGVPPDLGLYAVEARSRTGAGAIRARFAIGEPTPLDAPTGLAAEALAQGGARVTWSAVPRAASAFAALYTRPTDLDPASRFVAGQWVNGTEATFPAGTVQPGVAYDAYMTATDADVVGGGTPTRVSASENSYAPAGFVGR